MVLVNRCALFFSYSQIHTHSCILGFPDPSTSCKRSTHSFVCARSFVQHQSTSLGSAREMEEDALLDSCGVISERGRRPLVRPRGFVRSAARISPYPQVSQPAFDRLPHIKIFDLLFPPSRRLEVGLLRWSEGGRNRDTPSTLPGLTGALQLWTGEE